MSYSLCEPCPAETVPRWNAETDVLVVGFGAAGACAALAAADQAAKVMIVDVAAGHGGTSALSGGEIYVGGGGGTPMQRAAGFNDTTEDLYGYLMMAGGPNADSAKVRLYAQRSLEHFEWLQAQGVQYKNSYIADKIVEPSTDDCLIWSGSESAWPFRDAAKPAPRGHCPKYEGAGGGKYLMDALASAVQRRGAEVRFNTRAVALIANNERQVQGLVVRAGGEDQFIRARRGVILCTGGFVMNRDMVKRHAPLLLRSLYPIGTVDDGSGIRLGMSVGATTINMSEGFVTLPWYPPGSLVKGIFINERGQRFINEDCYHGRVSNMILQQPGDRIYLLQDQETYAEMEYAKVVRVDIAAAGESWEEVERELKLPNGSLLSTVSIYNEYASRGEDPLFHKAREWLKPLVNPPFVALDCRVDHCFYSSFTLGGLDTLPTGEVLTEDRDVIPGLFAAGRAACGLPRWGAGYSSGMSLADCTFFGREAGKQAASRSKSLEAR